MLGNRRAGEFGIHAPEYCSAAYELICTRIGRAVNRRMHMRNRWPLSWWLLHAGNRPAISAVHQATLNVNECRPSLAMGGDAVGACSLTVTFYTT